MRSHIVFIDYDEFDQSSYRAVGVNTIDDQKKRFATGDPVEDFESAMRWIVETYPDNQATVYSSSVDDFLNDGDKYHYDKHNLIKPARQYRLKR